MKPYKSPSPYSFHYIFFKQYWHIVGDDVFHLVNTAFQTGYFNPAISDTLISLIPKIDPPPPPNRQRLQTHQPLQHYLQNHYQSPCHAPPANP